MQSNRLWHHRQLARSTPCSWSYYTSHHLAALLIFGIALFCENVNQPYMVCRVKMGRQQWSLHQIPKYMSC